MTVVVDASVALKWFMQEDGSEEAAGLFSGPDLLIAPDLIVAELANASWKAVRVGLLSPQQQDQAAGRLGRLFDELVPLSVLAPRAVAISRALSHAVYDCFYLALAEARSGTLVTADRRFLLRVAGTQWADLARHLQPRH